MVTDSPCAKAFPTNQKPNTTTTIIKPPSLPPSSPIVKLPTRDENRRHHHILSSSMFLPDRIMVTASSWFRNRRSRFLILLLCSPVLLPFLCATLPLLCAAEICIRLCRRRRRSRRKIDSSIAQFPYGSAEEEEKLRRCEEGCGCEEDEEEEERKIGLLQRYLEDQLMLVGSVYECGDDYDEDCDKDHENLEFNRVSLLN